MKKSEEEMVIEVIKIYIFSLYEYHISKDLKHLAEFYKAIRNVLLPRTTIWGILKLDYRYMNLDIKIEYNRTNDIFREGLTFSINNQDVDVVAIFFDHVKIF